MPKLKIYVFLAEIPVCVPLAILPLLSTKELALGVEME
jgi:hypothetical protein